MGWTSQQRLRVLCNCTPNLTSPNSQNCDLRVRTLPCQRRRIPTISTTNSPQRFRGSIRGSFRIGTVKPQHRTSNIISNTQC